MAGPEVHKLPSSPTVEKTVLGTLLLWPEWRDTIGVYLRPSDFHDPLHAAIYKAALEIDGEANLSAIIGHLETRGNGAILKGDWKAYIKGLEDHAAFPSVAEHQARELHTLAECRRLLTDTPKALQAAYKGDLDGAIDGLRKVLQRVEGARWTEQEAALGLSEVRDFYGSLQWAWEGWIPIGHVTMLLGPQVVGKSYLCCYLIAMLTGHIPAWPDGQPIAVQPGPVVLVETEQMRGVYAERLGRLGVRDHDVVIPTRTGRADYEPELPKDFGLIRVLAERTGASAVVIDSLSGGHDLDENSAIMRTVMRELSELAGHLQKPVIVTHHPRKRSQFEPVRLTLERSRGSLTITQFARSVLMLYRLEDGPTGPVRVEQGKPSLLKPPEPWGFTITDNGIEFHEAPEEQKPMTAVDRAAEFLEAVLDRGPVKYSELLERAEEQGISKWSLYKARENLNVITARGYWSLPAKG